MEITIRQAQPEEADALAELHYAAWKAGYQGVMPDEVMQSLKLDEFYPRWRYRLSPAGAAHRILVAEQRGVLAGFITFGSGRESMQLPDAYHEIYTLYVHPSAWHQGIGRRLMNSVFSKLHQEGVEGCFLWVLKTNHAARMFYERMGMKLHEQERWISTHDLEVPVCCYYAAPVCPSRMV
jgi:ribosomal protein S18 acetylase RimI-like enzyme